MRNIVLLVFAVLAFNTHATDVQSATNSYLVPQDELVYIDTSEGQIVLQLLPQIAPNHVAQFKSLASSGWYNGLDFYRVIDGFVAQGGKSEREWKPIAEDKNVEPHQLKAEFTQLSNGRFYKVQKPDLLAPVTGYIDSIPAGFDPKTNEQWFLHCPGTVAMARGNDKDSASTDFYIVLGQAPRHLDRNMSLFARVVKGLDVVQRFPRGDKSKGGMIEPSAPKAKINEMRLGRQLPAANQVSVTIQSVHAKAFQSRLESVKHRTHEFYVHPGNGNVDVCYYAPAITVE